MDGNSSIERRYSFNIAQTTPVAESTHIGNSFSWGSSISMRPRSNSSLCLNHSHSLAKSRNVTKIDARIAADVQSKGLASRIVKYHENGGRLSRSMSAHNLYSRPGQFPVVKLKKTELPYRATKQELSMIRIPPPEKSTFYGNTISSLLKSSSVVGLKSKRTEENRPIIHPPPTENDMAPTRSVLDVLKEISRKRINSDDLETDETSKKYCNRGVSDLVDAGPCTASATTVTNIASQRYKRQRDGITPNQSILLPEARTSPEQAKKRVCNYNNDITSSLSSSVKSRCYGNKRASYNLDHTMSSNLEAHKTQTTKKQCFHDHQNSIDQTDVRLGNLVNNSFKVEPVKPITPIPATPCVLNEGKTKFVGSNGKTLTNEVQPVNKPRLTLFNKKYEVDVESDLKESIDKGDDLNNFDEYANISFVKPKKISISALKNPLIERTQKSKLALMLSGLRGELYQNSGTDDIDSSEEKQVKVNDNKLNVMKDTIISESKSVSTATTTLTSVTSSNNSNSGGVSDTKITTDLTTNKIAPVNQTNTMSNKTTSPLVGLKLNQVKSSTNEVASSVNVTKITDAIQNTNAPALGGFSLSATNTSNSASAFTTVTSIAPIIPTLTVSKASNLVTFGQPTASNSSIGLNLPTTKNNALSFPLVSTNTTNSIPHIITSNTNTTTSSNISTNTPKSANSFVFGANVTPLSTTTTDISKTVKTNISENAAKPNASFSFTTPLQTSAASLNPASSLTTSTHSLNTVSSQVTTSGIAFGITPTTSAITSITPAITTFSLNQSKTPLPVTVTKTSTDSSLMSTFSFSSKAPTTNVSTFSANNNAGITIPSFGSLQKTQNSASDDKNNSHPTNKGNNIFNTNPSAFFSASNLKTPISTPLFENSTNNTEKNVFSTSNVESTSVFGTNSIKADSKIFGSSAENKSSPFDGNSNKNSSPAPFSFGTKPSCTQTNTPGGFLFGSSISNSEGGVLGLGNTVKPTTTNSSTNVFGTVSSAALENKTFTFGSNLNSNKTENTTTSPGGFSFSTAAAQKPTVTFGTPGKSTAGFSFSGAFSPLPAETSIKPFSFGTQPQAQQSSIPLTNAASSNIFGSSGASKTMPSPGFSFNSESSTNLQQSGASKTMSSPGFSFNSESSTNLQQTGQPTNNIFASPSPNITTTGTGDRPIRRATRRLQK